MTQTTIAKVRSWIVGVAVLLVVALVAFFAYARYKTHQFISDLPKKLGGQITSTSDSFTYSQSVKGRTAFTIHASKAVQFKGGKSATLHDVVITLYGAGGDRRDRISGSEFDYDQAAGIVMAKGTVQIDLQGAGVAQSKGASNSAMPLSHDDSEESIHIQTSGLVFNQGTQVATTPEYVEFKTTRGSGHATGATYDVARGLLVLNSGVELDSIRNGDPVLVHASHAEFLRDNRQAFLLTPVTEYKGDQTSSDQAIVYFRQDGSAEHIDAQGHVHLKAVRGEEMTAGSAKIQLDLHSQAEHADARGGLNFVSTGDRQQLHGNAVEGTLTFRADGSLSHAQARNAVSFVEQQRGLGDDPNGSATRELRASKVDIDFGADAEGHARAEKVLASGQATAVLHTIRTKGASQNTTLHGDQLVATLDESGRAIHSLYGSGHTSVLDLAANGTQNLSSGDELTVLFAAPATKNPGSHEVKSPGVSMQASEIETVVQEGTVAIVQTPAFQAGRVALATHATARRADYDAVTQNLRLTGLPHLDDGETSLIADTIDYHRVDAQATATGNVKATYLQPKGQAANRSAAPGLGGGDGPTHVISESARLDQSRGSAVFRGRAKLWQGGSSVAAPVIELSRSPAVLKAYGEADAPGEVTTILASASTTPRQAGVYRVQSRKLLYADADHKATFTGAVTAEEANGTVHSDLVEVFLASAASAGKTPVAATRDSGGGRIDRIVASGHVVLQQPGRRGTGEKLLYTAEDGRFVLTGTSATPPRLYDQAHGTVSGQALILDSQDDSVSVSGGQTKAVTDTRTAK